MSVAFGVLGISVGVIATRHDKTCQKPLRRGCRLGPRSSHLFPFDPCALTLSRPTALSPPPLRRVSRRSAFASDAVRDAQRRYLSSPPAFDRGFRIVPSVFCFLPSFISVYVPFRACCLFSAGSRRRLNVWRFPRFDIDENRMINNRGKTKACTYSK